MDALLLAAAVAEIRRRAVPARIERVTQPAPAEVLLQLHAGTTVHLMLSADPQTARLHLTGRRRPGPPAPPAFCTVLRRWIEGRRLVGIAQPGLERLVHLEVAGWDELGNPGLFRLVAELMGARPNLVLLDAGGRVIDALRRIPGADGRLRTVLPGRPYVPPPAQGDKLDPLVASPGEVAARLGARAADGAGGAAARGDGEVAAHPPGVAAALAGSVLGLSRDTARLVAQRAGVDPDAAAGDLGAGEWTALAEAVAAMARSAADGEVMPTAARSVGGRAAVLPWPPPGTPPPAVRPVGAVCDEVYGARDEAERLRQARQSLLDALGVRLQRARRKLSRQEDEWRDSEAAELHRMRGELLLAHGAEVPPGVAAVELPAFDDPDRLVAVPLDPRLPPAANAQAHFRQYRKAQRRRRQLEAVLAQTREEVALAEDALFDAQRAESLAEIGALADDLRERGLLRAEDGRGGSRPARTGRTGARPAARGGGRPPEPPRPLRFRSADGYTILAGRNSRQNDWLTLREARPDDWWLHVKDFPGAHVVVRVPPERAADRLPEPTLRQAAALAAHLSAARQGSHVPVDVTRRRHVWKPRGARPGLVNYDHHHTLSVTPRVEDLPPEDAGSGGG